MHFVYFVRAVFVKTSRNARLVQIMEGGAGCHGAGCSSGKLLGGGEVLFPPARS